MSCTITVRKDKTDDFLWIMPPFRVFPVFSSSPLSFDTGASTAVLLIEVYIQFLPSYNPLVFITTRMHYLFTCVMHQARRFVSWGFPSFIAFNVRSDWDTHQLNGIRRWVLVWKLIDFQSGYYDYLYSVPIASNGNFMKHFEVIKVYVSFA